VIFFFEGTGGACTPTGILLKKKHSVTTRTGSKLKKQRKKQKKEEITQAVLAID
jgi:hypothetical protein